MKVTEVPEKVSTMHERTIRSELMLCLRAILVAGLVGTTSSGFLSLPCLGQVAKDQTAEVDEPVLQESKIKTDFLGDPLPPHALIRLGTNRFNPSQAHSVVLSADDNIAITLGNGLMAWDASSGKLLWQKPTTITRMSAASYGNRPLCRMPKSGQLVTPTEDGSIEFWDVATGDKIRSVSTATKGPFKSIDVSPDESLFALGGASLTIVCDQSGKEKYRIENHPKKQIEGRNTRDRLTFGGEFSYGRFSPDGKSLALVNSEFPQTIQVLNADSGEVKHKIDTAGRVVRMDFSPDSRHVITTQRDISARMYELETGKQVWEKVFSISGLDERYTTDIQVSPNGDLVAVGTAIGEDQRIQLLDPKTGNPVGALKGHTWKPWCLQFTSDGRKLYSTGWDGVVRRWDIAKREQIRIENSERASGICSMAPNGRTLAFCDDSGKLHIVDIVNGQKLKSLGFEGTAFSQVIYSQDCQRLAAGGSSKNDLHIYVWNLENGEVLHHWEWPKGRDVHSSVESLSFSRDANRLAAAVFRQSACYVFDLPTDKQIAKVRHGNVYGLSMRPDGHQFVSAGWDKAIRLWDCETGESEKTVAVDKGGDPRMYGVLFSPDARTIASLSLGGTIRTWSPELEEIKEFKIKSRAVFGSLQFSRNGLWLGVGQMNGQTNVYDVQTGEVVWDLAKHDKYVYNVDFGADDGTLLTGGSDGVCYVWDLNSSRDETSHDFEKLAKDLIGESPREAFDAYQSLADDPEQAVPAIRTATESMFANWDEPDDTELNNLNHRVHRVAMFLAQTEASEAENLLDSLLKNSPNGSIKKTIFLATRQREKYLERMGKENH